jgi:type II secretory pathway component PulF
MKQFAYKLIDSKGFLRKGDLLANSISEARENLIDDKTTIVSIKQNYLYIPFTLQIKSKKKIKAEDIINFTRQLQILMESGIPLLGCLKIIRTMIKNLSMQQLLDKLIGTVVSGEPFSQSLSPHVKLFGNDYIALIRAGEKSGNLDKILLDIYHLMNWEYKLKKRIMGALRYPLIVLGITIAALIGMFKFVVPKFAVVFTKSKKKLPLPTIILLAVNKFLSSYGLIILILSIIGFVAGSIAYKRTEFKKTVDRVMIKIPVFGYIYQQYIVARFCKVFSMLYRRGIPVMNTLAISKKINNNAIYQQDIDTLIFRMQRGVLIGESSKETTLFNGLVGQMAGIGEKSSNLDTMLDKVSELFSDEIDYILDNIFAYIEPLFISIMGMLILTLAFGILLPMWQMMKILSVTG